VLKGRIGCGGVVAGEGDDGGGRGIFADVERLLA